MVALVKLMAAMLLFSIAAGWPERLLAEAQPRVDPFPDRATWTRIRQSRPHARGELREQNISDIEVQQIQEQARALFPGAIVNIGSVTTYCPCEDGPDCEGQVGIVAYRPENSVGLVFSSIGQEWVVGPVQQWWLRYEANAAKLRALAADPPDDYFGAREALYLRRAELWNEFPECVAPSRGDG